MSILDQEQNKVYIDGQNTMNLIIKKMKKWNLEEIK